MRALACILLTLTAFTPRMLALPMQSPGPAVSGAIASSSGGSSPAVIHTSVNTATMNFGSGTITLSPAATAGNVLIVEFFQTYPVTSTLTVVDNNGTSLTNQTGSPQTVSGGGGSGVAGAVLYELAYTVPVGGATSLTFTFTGSFAEAIAMEVTHLASPTMQAYSASYYTYGNYNPLPTATPTSSPSLGLGAFFNYGGTAAPGAGWTTAGLVSTSGTTFYMEWTSVTGTSPVSAPVTGMSTNAPTAFANIW